MKATLLFVLAFFIGFTLSAQKSAKPLPVKSADLMVKHLPVEPVLDANVVVPSHSPKASKSTSAVGKVFMGSSINAYTLLLAEQTCMWYDKDLDLIMATYRGDQVTPGIGTGNDIINYWSADGGATFAGKIGFLGTDAKRNRYPAGVIYNLPGNTDIEQAFSLIACPITSGSGWDYNATCGVQKNGDNQDVKYRPTSGYGELIRQGLTTCTDGTAHYCTMKSQDDGTNYTAGYGFVVNGKFNSNTYLFEFDTVAVQIPWLVNGGFPEMSSDLTMAWNKDGSVGYLLARGIDAGATGHKGYYPILMKSVDKGKTWQHVAYFDMSTLSCFRDNIYPITTDDNVFVPYFTEQDMTVDANGNPHIFAKVKGSYSQHPDSLGYVYSNDPGAIFEVALEGSEWKGFFVEKLKSQDVVTADSPFYSSSGNVGWDMRVQASRTDDGKKVFGIWTDTDWQFFSQTDSINLNPDLYIWGRDVVANKHTAAKNVTYLEEGMGECYFMFASPITRDKSGEYQIPVGITDINVNVPPNADLPVMHYFLKGASFTDADFSISAIAPRNKASELSVTNFPNPFNGVTTLTLNLERPSKVSVNINSVTGQQLRTVNFGLLSAGTHQLKLDAKGLGDGLYFYTVNAGEQQATRKMVIK